MASGQELLQQFCLESGITDSVSMTLFDHHNVVDEMSYDTAARVGVELSHLENHASILLSYGHRHRKATFDETRACFPMIAELDGYIFTDFRCNWNASVHVYQDDWMNEAYHDNGRRQCAIIGVRGDKGQIAGLLSKTCTLVR